MFDVRWCWRQHRGTRVLHVHESGRARRTGGAGLGEIKGGLKSAGSDKQGLSQQKGSARNFGVATRIPGKTVLKKIGILHYCSDNISQGFKARQGGVGQGG